MCGPFLRSGILVVIDAFGGMACLLLGFLGPLLDRFREVPLRVGRRCVSPLSSLW